MSLLFLIKFLFDNVRFTRKNGNWVCLRPSVAWQPPCMCLCRMQLRYLQSWGQFFLAMFKWPAFSRAECMSSSNACISNNLDLAVNVTVSFSSRTSGITLVSLSYWVISTVFLCYVFFVLFSTIQFQGNLHSSLIASADARCHHFSSWEWRNA